MGNFTKFVSDLTTFKNQITDNKKDLASFSTSDDLSQQPKVMKIRKNLILAACADSSGCGHIRCIFPMTYINAVFGKGGRLQPCVLPYFCMQHEILVHTRSILFQRTMNPAQLPRIVDYKNLQEKYRYKMIYDIDDFIWKGDDFGEGIPEYNFGSQNVKEEAAHTAIEVMKMMDTVCVSTKFLADYIKNVLKVPNEIKVVPNVVPMYLTGSKRKPKITEKIKRPKLLWTASPTHYHEGKRLKGDIDNAWCDYIIKAVKDNKIEFKMMGVEKAPFFFDEIKSYPNFSIVPWLNSYQYFLPILDYMPDFSIMPLVPNYFNYSKSDLKAIESYAYGAIAIGTSPFSTGKPSPYDDIFCKLPDTCTVEDIERKIDEYSEPDLYNKTVNDQQDVLIKNSRYLESPGHINYLVSIL